MRAKEERELAAKGEGCLGKAADDEPVFILRGQDAFAAPLVRMWATLAEIVGCQKADGAYKLADLMEAWEPKKVPD